MISNGFFFDENNIKLGEMLINPNYLESEKHLDKENSINNTEGDELDSLEEIMKEF